MAVGERDLMGGFAKGLKVLEAFGPERQRLSITDASDISGLDRATARRCLLTLAELGYADYDGKYFTLTPRILRLGTACLATMPLPQMVQPLLDRLSDELGESSSVSILDGADIVYVARAAQRKVMSIALMPGSRLPAFCTSMGRVMLAALPEAEARTLLESEALVARTQHTVTQVDMLMAILAEVRAHGHALIDQEVELGLRSIAVPVQNSRGKVVAALNIGLPANRAEIDELVRLYLAPMQKVQAELRGMLN